MESLIHISRVQCHAVRALLLRQADRTIVVGWDMTARMGFSVVFTPSPTSHHASVCVPPAVSILTQCIAGAGLHNHKMVSALAVTKTL
jgi:hypothetical protein